jgi:hypothetical protein
VAVSVVVKLRGVTVDPANVIADVAIRSGRDRADDGLSASSATVEFMTPDPAGAGVNIADKLDILINGKPRFSGNVVEITRAASSDPASTTFTIVGVGPIARLPRVNIAMPLAAGTARARIQAVLDAAGITAVIGGGQTHNLAAYGLAGDPPVGADQVIGDIINDTGVVVADLGDGSILCQFLDSRISADQWTPDPARTFVDLQWEQTDDLVNDIVIEWPGGAPVTNSNPGSITTYGRRAASLQTGLATLADAQARAAGIIARLAAPAWNIGTVETWDPAALDHGIGAVVTISPLGPSAPVSGDSWFGVLEGWDEQYGPDAEGTLSGTWELAVSDRAHSSETVSWAHVYPSTLQWNQVNPGCSWQEALSNSDLYP